MTEGQSPCGLSLPREAGEGRRAKQAGVGDSQQPECLVRPPHPNPYPNPLPASGERDRIESAAR
jgi:hypothetical protein